MQQLLVEILHLGAYAAIVMGFMFVAKLIADVRTRSINDDAEISDNANLAIGLRRAGLYLATAIGMTGALTGPGGTFKGDVIALLIDGATLLPLLFIARAFNDLILLRGIKNDDAAKAGNVSVGIVECGSYLATGLILSGALAGEGGGIASVLVFAALGQIGLFIMFSIYDAVTPFKVIEEVKRDNRAAAVGVAGLLTAIGFLLKASITGPFVSWLDDLISFGVAFVVGVVMLLLFRAVAGLLMLPKTGLAKAVRDDKNVSALVVIQATLVAIGLVISAVI